MLLWAFFLAVYLALSNRRQISETNRIEMELNAKNSMKKNSLCSQVDPESVDWLSGKYSLRDPVPCIVDRDQHPDEVGSSTLADIKAPHTIPSLSSTLPEIDIASPKSFCKEDGDGVPGGGDHEHLPFIRKRSEDDLEYSSVFSSTRHTSGTYVHVHLLLLCYFNEKRWSISLMDCQLTI